MNGNAVSIGVVIAEAVGEPNFWDRFYVCRGREVQLKAGCQHAHNLGAKWSVGNHHVSEDAGIEAVATLEVFVTEDGHDGKRGRRWGSRLGYARRWGRLRQSVTSQKPTDCRNLPHLRAQPSRGHQRRPP